MTGRSCTWLGGKCPFPIWSMLRDTAEAVNRAIPGARITVGDSGPYRLDGKILSAVKGALDISRARTELGYAPCYDLQRGIEATIAATRERLTGAASS